MPVGVLLVELPRQEDPARLAESLYRPHVDMAWIDSFRLGRELHGPDRAASNRSIGVWLSLPLSLRIRGKRVCVVEPFMSHSLVTLFRFVIHSPGVNQ